MKQNIELRQVRDFGELVNDTFTFVKQNWQPLLRAILIICGVFLVASTVASILQQQQMYGAISREGEMPRFGKIFSAEYFLSMLFSFMMYFAMSLTTLTYINVYLEKGNQQPSVEEVWAHFKYFFLRYTCSQLLLTLLVMLGFAFCLVPGIYLLPVISLISCALIFENSTLGYAFNRGFKLIKENWWTTFGAIIVILFVFYGLLMLFVLPVSFISGAGRFLTNQKISVTMMIITSILQHLCMIFMVITQIVAALCYFSLVEKKEGSSLMDKVNRIGQNGFYDDNVEEQY